MITSLLGFSTTSNFRLREITSYSEFYNEVSKVIPKYSILSFYPTKSEHNFHPNIFMGHDFVSTDGYLSPTPYNYANKMLEISKDTNLEKIRYKDFTEIIFRPKDNESYNKIKFEEFLVDYVKQKEKLSDKKFTFVEKIKDFYIYKFNSKKFINKVNISINCTKEIEECTLKPVKYFFEKNKMIFLLRYDANLILTINKKNYNISQCKNFFLCIDKNIENTTILQDIQIVYNRPKFKI